VSEVEWATPPGPKDRWAGLAARSPGKHLRVPGLGKNGCTRSNVARRGSAHRTRCTHTRCVRRAWLADGAPSEGALPPGLV